MCRERDKEIGIGGDCEVTTPPLCELTQMTLIHVPTLGATGIGGSPCATLSNGREFSSGLPPGCTGGAWELLGEGGGEPLGEQHFGELLGSCRWDYRARDRGSGGSERRR